ncbi:hypothetical protein CLAFUW4_14845 [Fulvia fulva]|nr:hypothetical protein CLAFUR0_14838 [Fulvia fulva]WPV23006.1 hypothetical protein CLAFUW4_14845 [Fulvia fulva]WPV37939.1 hypothetical protein CLAFUW7_14846 [Fulvia fulva]
MAFFEHERARATVQQTLNAFSSDRSRIVYIEQFLDNNVDSTQMLMYKILYLWTWLREHSPAAADQLNSRKENLQHLVSSASAVVADFTTKTTGIAARWPEWTWEFGEYAPETYSGRMVDSLVKLSHKIKDNLENRRAGPERLRQAVIDRLVNRKTSLPAGSPAAKLQNADIEKVWRDFGGKTRKEAARRSESIEIGRPGPAPAPRSDAESSLFVRDSSLFDARNSSSHTFPRSSPPPSPRLSPASPSMPIASRSPRSTRPPPSPGHFAGQQAGIERPAKRPKAAAPPPMLSPLPAPAPVPMPPAPVWAEIFEAQRRHDEAVLAAATTEEERDAARAAINATTACQATLPAHFRRA